MAIEWSRVFLDRRLDGAADLGCIVLPDEINLNACIDRTIARRRLEFDERRKRAKARAAFLLERDRFNPLDFFAGECELLDLEVLSHMLLACGSSQRQHADLHGKPKDDLCRTRL
jgi:hypothetical protein